MKCPECGEEMEKGQISASAWPYLVKVYWEKEEEAGLGTRIWPESVWRTWKHTPRFKAHRCKNCKLITFFEYFEEEPLSAKELYERLIYFYTAIYGGGKLRLDRMIESYVKKGLSREEAILKLAREKIKEKE